jgi:hypothetical protein
MLDREPHLRARDPGAEGGRGLDGVLRLRQDGLSGILNGIDTDSWNPSTDQELIRDFDVQTLSRRPQNKVALQDDAGLEKDARMPLLGVVSRLVKEKGFDIAAPAVKRWLDRGGQFVLLGTGDPAIEHEFAQFEMRYPHRASVRLRFDARYARRIYAGADALLIPSRYEPCGLAQMIGMRYGCVPVARRTGGLADTVVDAGDPGPTGLMFDEFHPWALWDALERALRVYAPAHKMGRTSAQQDVRTSPGRSPRRSMRPLRRERRTSPRMRRAVILAGGGSRLGVLTEKRAKPAVPVRRQVPDHRLRCRTVNSGIRHDDPDPVPPHSLNEHRVRGARGTSTAASPAASRSTSLPQPGATDWYRGTADAIAPEHLLRRARLAGSRPGAVGRYIYKMNYG